VPDYTERIPSGTVLTFWLYRSDQKFYSELNNWARSTKWCRFEQRTQSVGLNEIWTLYCERVGFYFSNFLYAGEGVERTILLRHGTVCLHTARPYALPSSEPHTGRCYITWPVHLSTHYNIYIAQGTAICRNLPILSFTAQRTYLTETSSSSSSSFCSLWSAGHPWRASSHCGLQQSPWPRSMISLFLLLQCPYIPKPYSSFPFHAKEVTAYSGRLIFISVSLIIVFKLCRLLAYSTWSQWWGCHLSFWADWFSVVVSSPNLWRSTFFTRQWCWFWSTLGILFPQYPPYLVSLPLSATWGGARWETSDSTRVTEP
jgi:hypothetical protein